MLIRADAGPKIGIGHVMRCLALAQAWRAAGGRAMLLGVCLGDSLREPVRRAGVELQPLEAKHPHPNDLATTVRLIDEWKSNHDSSDPTWVVLDGYHFDEAYQESIGRTGCRVLVVDDMAQWSRYGADLVLNQNLGCQTLDYDCTSSPETVLLLGRQYVLMRPEFLDRDQDRDIPATARRILVTLGGADPDNTTEKVIGALERLDIEGMEAKIVVGPANPRRGALQTRIGRLSDRIELTRPTDGMPQLMAWADVAVSAAGSTCWEMARLGLPGLVTVLADNQRMVALPLAAAGTVANLEPADRLSSEEIRAALDSLCRDQTARRRQSEAGRKLIDGRGAERAVSIMRSLDGPFPDDEPRLRAICQEDMLAVWRLANDPVARQNSFAQDSIPLESHVEWFQAKLASPDTRIWVLDFHGVLAGIIRYDLVDRGTAVISFSVAPAFRRRGLGTRLVKETGPLVREQLHPKRLRAEVFQRNSPSARVFRRLGFTRIESRQIHGHACDVFEQTV